MESELELLEAKLLKDPNDLESIASYLRGARECKVRVSENVCRHGSTLLSKGRSKLSEDEFWLLHEQVAVAAMDCSAAQLALSCVKAIAKKFPESIRARRLQGMFYESQSDFQRAEEVYKEILEIEPNNESAMKRQVALERSKGNPLAAVDLLIKYLDVQQGDTEGWLDLSDLYIELLMFRQAAFCVEELIQSGPSNSVFYLKYADILYTIGGNNNLKTAKTYYAKALELSGGHSVRAMYGICASVVNSTDKVVLQDSRSRAQIELPGLAATALISLYSSSAPDKLPMVKAMIEGIGM